MNRYLLIPLFAIVSWGCSGEAATEMPDELQPTYGGTLVFGKNAAPITLDPAVARETESTDINDNLFEGLVSQTGGKVGLEPCLARSWDISEDGTSYTFHLRSGVLFHDGSPFTADAVAFTFNRQRDPKHPHYGSGDYDFWRSFDMDRIVKDIQVVDDSTIQIRLFEANATFLNLLSMGFLSVISPDAMRKSGIAFEKNPVGTGPFRFVRWEPNGTVVLSYNDAHWSGRPYLDTVVYRPIPNAKSRWSALREGSITMMTAPDQSDMQEIKTTPGIKCLSQPGVNIAYLAMNLEKKPFDNLKVRQAIAYAIDRERLVNRVYGQYGRPAKNPIPPILLGYNENIHFTPYDPDRARKLLAEAGYPNGFKCSLWTFEVTREYLTNPKLAAEYIQKDLKEIGIEVNLIVKEWGDFLTGRGLGEHDLSMSGWIGDAPDPHFFFYPLLDKTSAANRPSNNIAFYKSEEMHRLLYDAKMSPDPLKRSALYQKACEVFNQDLPWFTIAHSLAIIPMRNEVMNFQKHSSSVRKFDRTWLEKQNI